jgi:hypothetical protein
LNGRLATQQLIKEDHQLNTEEDLKGRIISQTSTADGAQVVENETVVKSHRRSI